MDIMGTSIAWAVCLLGPKKILHIIKQMYANVCIFNWFHWIAINQIKNNSRVTIKVLTQYVWSEKGKFNKIMKKTYTMQTFSDRYKFHNVRLKVEATIPPSLRTFAHLRLLKEGKEEVLPNKISHCISYTEPRNNESWVCPPASALAWDAWVITRHSWFAQFILTDAKRWPKMLSSTFSYWYSVDYSGVDDQYIAPTVPAYEDTRFELQPGFRETQDGLLYECPEGPPDEGAVYEEPSAYTSDNGPILPPRSGRFSTIRSVVQGLVYVRGGSFGVYMYRPPTGIGRTWWIPFIPSI